MIWLPLLCQLRVSIGSEALLKRSPAFVPDVDIL